MMSHATLIERLNQLLAAVEVRDPIRWAFWPRMEFVLEGDMLSPHYGRPVFWLKCTSKNAEEGTEKEFVPVRIGEAMFEAEIEYLSEHPGRVGEFVYRKLMQMLEHELQESFFINGQYLHDPHPGKRRTE